MGHPTSLPAVIANNGSLSAAVDLRMMAGTRVVTGLQIPDEWDAAGIGLLASYDGGSTYTQVRVLDQTTAPPYGLDEFEILAADIPTSEASFIPLDPTLLLGATHVKVQSQTAGTPVAQSPARTIGVCVRDLD